MSRSRRRRYRRRLLAAVVAACLSVPLVPVPVAAAEPVVAAAGSPRGALHFATPVDAPVSDGWRPPETPYGPGNRGWEYVTSDGEKIRAAGDGTVSFAGPVGGSVAVTVRHVGGLRTTYSLLTSTSVRVGDRVGRGDEVGTAGERFHFGALLHDEYIDPALLFTPGALRLGARLIPLAGTAAESATLTPRSAHRSPTMWVASDPNVPEHLAPGPPTVATRAGPGTSNRWEGDGSWPLSA